MQMLKNNVLFSKNLKTKNKSKSKRPVIVGINTTTRVELVETREETSKGQGLLRFTLSQMSSDEDEFGVCPISI